MEWVALAGAAGLVLVHLFVGRLTSLHGVPRSAWLSAAGGAAVAYVFIHLLPELASARQTIEESEWDALRPIAEHVYTVALASLAAFYGLEHFVRSRRGDSAAEERSHVFWLHIAAFTLYNAIIGSIIASRAEQELRDSLLFAAAMALHFLASDIGMRTEYSEHYDHTGRWLLVSGLVAGVLAGLTLPVNEETTAILIALIAGAVVLNVLKEELPEERQSRFGAFLAGAAGYGAILLWLN